LLRQARSNPLAWWWALLALGSSANIALWFMMYHQYASRPSGSRASAFDPELMLFLCAAYVFGCAFRSFLPRADLQRTRDLASRRVVSKAELDSAESKFKQKEGSVAQMRSMISKKEVRAPFDGQLGIRQVNIGQSIEARTPIVALTSLDPVFIDFALPQQELTKLSPGLEVSVRTDAVPGREFKGKLTAINSMIDATTRNVSLQGTLDNPDHALHPGMFAKVELRLPEKHKALVVPGSAVSYAPFGDSVFVIEKKKDPKTGKESETIRQQFVRVGEARGDLVSIVDGLKANETIVSTGVFKLRNGMSVTINNDLSPKLEENPKPADT